MTTGRTRRAAAAAALALALVAGGCGKKGAPLAPFVRIPAAVDTIAAARVGHQVYVTLTVPTENIDASVPVDVARVEVYGYTGVVAPSRVRWVELGRLVATIPVSPLPTAAGPGEPAPPRDPDAASALPGASVTILDALDADELVQGPVAPVDPRFPDLAAAPTANTPSVLRRFYVAVPFSERGRPGPPGGQAELRLTPLPDPPTGLRATYDQTAVSLAWEPSGGLLGYLLDRPLPEEPVPFDIVEPAPGAGPQASEEPAMPGPTTYQIYRDEPPDPIAQTTTAPSPSWRAAVPAAINPAPVSATTSTDTLEFGRERCYTVRAQRGGVLSEPSERACVMPTDVFPPAPPVGLTTVASEGAINLIWEPNTEGDLGGYLVLRRGPGDATLRQLTDMPIRDTRYRDATVESGVRYSYAVAAVDRQVPAPNVSVPSAPVDEVAR